MKLSNPEITIQIISTIWSLTSLIHGKPTGELAHTRSLGRFKVIRLYQLHYR